MTSDPVASHNRYAVWAYLIAGIFAAAIAYDLLRMPVQVYDSLNEILEASRQASVVRAFTASFEGKAYMRPLRIAQIKALFDVRTATTGWCIAVSTCCSWDCACGSSPGRCACDPRPISRPPPPL